MLLKYLQIICLGDFTVPFVGGTGVFDHTLGEVKTWALRKSSLRPSKAVIYIRTILKAENFHFTTVTELV